MHLHKEIQALCRWKIYRSQYYYAFPSTSICIQKAELLEQGLAEGLVRVQYDFHLKEATVLPVIFADKVCRINVQQI